MAAGAATTKGKGVVLAVDDSPDILALVNKILSQWFEVRTAGDGPTALRMVQEAQQPDLILLDVMMPDLNGFQFLSIYRKDEENAQTPVVILSSLSEEADVLKGLEIGAADYLTKPFSPQVLIAKIKKNISSRP